MASISAVLPAYNEEAIIAETARAMVTVLRDLVDDYEVIVVNDGSRDATAARVAAVAAELPAVRLVSHAVNRGYGSALATGFSAATKDWIFLTDGDKQFDAREIAGFIPEMQDADLVVGVRQPRRDPLPRRLNGWGWNLLVRLLFGPVARDVDCAFKLFRREVWEAVQVESGGATFSAEFLVKARRAGFRLRERRVTHLPRTAGRATGARPDVILRAFRDLFRLRLSLPPRTPPATALAAYGRVPPQGGGAEPG
ncbi:MAG TPA: glycosyltransferase family 2 protein [Chloroflexota bacterium]|nr:glycosyltransferase family 2 protein [Chloroflexota bacterium]